MKDRKAQLIAEIKSINEQYNAEINRGRKSWPNSIRVRVEEIRNFGDSWKQISEETGVPYYTLLNWRQKAKKELASSSKGRFKAVTVTDPPSRRSPRLTVTIADRVKIEGLETAEVLQLIRPLIK